jgi:hypothetical protein
LSVVGFISTVLTTAAAEQTVNGTSAGIWSPSVGAGELRLKKKTNEVIPTFYSALKKKIPILMIISVNDLLEITLQVNIIDDLI